jgi:hypothetical protein
VVLVIIAQFPTQVHDLSHKLKIILRMPVFEGLVRIAKEFDTAKNEMQKRPRG